MQIEAVVEKISKEAKRRFTAEDVFHANMNVGDYHRQGDVYIQRIATPDRNALSETKIRTQIAPGISQGARHCISDATLRHVRMYEKINATALDGPMLECFKPVKIDHPEHGACTVPPGWYAITFQRQYAEELRRVQD